MVIFIQQKLTTECDQTQVLYTTFEIIGEFNSPENEECSGLDKSDGRP